MSENNTCCCEVDSYRPILLKDGLKGSIERSKEIHGTSRWLYLLVHTLLFLIGYNLLLFSLSLLFYNLSWTPLPLSPLLSLLRHLNFSYLGALIRSDLLSLFSHPLYFAAHFLIYAFLMGKRFPCKDTSSWDLLPLGNSFFNFLFRPSEPPSRMFTSDVHFDLRFEQFVLSAPRVIHAPNLWLQTSLPRVDYISDLPVFEYKGWRACPHRGMKMICRVMDGESPTLLSSRDEVVSNSRDTGRMSNTRDIEDRVSNIENMGDRRSSTRHIDESSSRNLSDRMSISRDTSDRLSMSRDSMSNLRDRRSDVSSTRGVGHGMSTRTYRRRFSHEGSSTNSFSQANVGQSMSTPEDNTTPFAVDMNIPNLCSGETNGPRRRVSGSVSSSQNSSDNNSSNSNLSSSHCSHRESISPRSESNANVTRVSKRKYNASISEDSHNSNRTSTDNSRRVPSIENTTISSRENLNSTCTNDCSAQSRPTNDRSHRASINKDISNCASTKEDRKMSSSEVAEDCDYLECRLIRSKDCAICLEPYVEHTILLALPCAHHFHKSCILPWLQRVPQCPVCRWSAYEQKYDFSY